MFSTLPAMCEGLSHEAPVMGGFDVLFDANSNKQLNKQLSRQWFMRQ